MHKSQNKENSIQSSVILPLPTMGYLKQIRTTPPKAIRSTKEMKNLNTPKTVKISEIRCNLEQTGHSIQLYNL